MTGTTPSARCDARVNGDQAIRQHEAELADQLKSIISDGVDVADKEIGSKCADAVTSNPDTATEAGCSSNCNIESKSGAASAAMPAKQQTKAI
jgi:NADPH-dependent curcumin reductase CurA